MTSVASLFRLVSSEDFSFSHAVRFALRSHQWVISSIDLPGSFPFWRAPAWHFFASRLRRTCTGDCVETVIGKGQHNHLISRISTITRFIHKLLETTSRLTITLISCHHQVSNLHSHLGPTSFCSSFLLFIFQHDFQQQRPSPSCQKAQR